MQVAAKGDVQIQSKSSHIDWAAAKKITLATAGGASIVIEGGNITVMCSGKITVRAGTKSFVGAETTSQGMPEMPRASMSFDEKFQLQDPSGDPLGNVRYELIKPNGTRVEGVSDAQGMVPIQQGFSPNKVKLRILGRAKKEST